jgi:hypothetical protein
MYWFHCCDTTSFFKPLRKAAMSELEICWNLGIMNQSNPGSTHLSKETCSRKEFKGKNKAKLSRIPVQASSSSVDPEFSWIFSDDKTKIHV